MCDDMSQEICKISSCPVKVQVELELKSPNSNILSLIQIVFLYWNFTLLPVIINNWTIKTEESWVMKPPASLCSNFKMSYQNMF